MRTHGQRERGPQRTAPGLLDRSRYTDLAICTAGHYEHAAGHSCRRAEVREYQVGYCTGGRGRITCAGRTVSVRPGGLFINIPGHPHEYGTSARAPWTLWWVHFVGTAAGRYFELIGCRPSEPAFHIGLNDRLVDLFKEMLQALSRQERHYQVAAVSHLHQILSLLACLRREGEGGRTSRKSAKRLDMAGLNRLIERDFSGLSLDRLARHAGVSVPHFERLFRAQTGYSPMAFVLRRRIATACELLLARPDLTVKEVSVHVGYEDQHYFSRVFKKITGFPPVQYRQAYIPAPRRGDVVISGQ